MPILIVVAITAAAVFAAFYWWIQKLQHHKRARGAISFVVLPAALGPIALLLCFVFILFAVLYSMFG